MSKKFFGTDGIRGVTSGKSDGLLLTPEFCLSLGRAAARMFGEIDFIMGFDTRASSPMIVGAICAGIFAEGKKVTVTGIIPSPGVAYLAKSHRSIGIMVTASHNPSEYNGIKFFTSEGEKLSDEDEEKLEELILPEGISQSGRIKSGGKILYSSEFGEEYLDRLCDIARAFLPAKRKPIKLAIDTANGAVCKYAARLFLRLGMSPHFIGNEPSGDNINLGCGATHTEALSKTVVQEGLEFGFTFDGDGDRCLAADERGEIIDGDAMTAIFTDAFERWGLFDKKCAVGTAMSNSALSVLLSSRGVKFYAADVGDKYVRREMLRTGAPIGGENSGHMIFRDLGTTGDGLITAILMLAVYLDGDTEFSALRGEYLSFPSVTINCPVSTDAKQRFRESPDEEILNAIAEAKARLENVGSVLVRASGTEPCIRVTVECKNREEAESVATELAKLIERNYSL